MAATRTRGSARRAAEHSYAIHLYCGKGGVGKTTLAAAGARKEAARGRRVLVVSTDPAHSLGDALGRRLTAVPTPVPVPRASGRLRRPRGGRLHAAELDPARALERWLGSRRSAFERLLLRGTLLDRDDVDRLLRLSLPGVDELVALVEIERLALERRPDLVVVDTAPTGHTWRLLEAPDTIESLARVLDGMLAHDRDVAAAVGGRAPRDMADTLVEELADDARRLAARLRDPKATRIIWVTLAEPVAVAEALDGIAWLRDRGLPLAQIVVNRDAVPSRTCPMCRARAAVGRASLGPLRKAARGVTVTFVRDKPVGRVSSTARRKGAVPPARPATVVTEGLKLIVVAGKGGVGKTTVAAGLALDLARRAAGRVLLLSTDPAHSLADVLRVELGDRPRPVPGAGALEAREIDAAAALARERDGLRRAIVDGFGASASSGSGVRVDLAYDRETALRLLDLTPPGVDEIFALVSVIDALDRYDCIVVDAAPTGHALKLLAMPELATAWLSELMRILLKYQAVARVGPLAEQLVRLSRGARRLQALLRDRAQTRVVVVTRAAELPRMETLRLLAAVDTLGISTAAVIVNAVTPPGARCPRCRAAGDAEGVEVSKLVRDVRTEAGSRPIAAGRPRRASRCDIIVAPLVLPPPRGVDRLASWTRRWTEGD